MHNLFGSLYNEGGCLYEFVSRVLKDWGMRWSAQTHWVQRSLCFRLHLLYPGWTKPGTRITHASTDNVCTYLRMHLHGQSINNEQLSFAYDVFRNSGDWRKVTLPVCVCMNVTEVECVWHILCVTQAQRQRNGQRSYPSTLIKKQQETKEFLLPSLSGT